MERVKVIHVYKSFNVYNGLIEILTIMAQNIDHSRYELGVCVYEYKDSEFGKKFEELGGKIYNLNIPPNILNKHEEFLSLYRFFKKEKPDIVQTHVLKANLFGTVAARMAKVPVVIATEMTLKDIASSNISRFRDRLIQPLVGFVVNRCDRFVVTSQYIKNEWAGNLDNERFEVIYPPFNIDKYEKAISNHQSIFKSAGKRIGFVGRLSEEKSVNTLIDAMVIVNKSYPDAELSIIGTGPMEKLLKKQCTELNLNKTIRFEGYKSNSFESLKTMDIFVLPSRTEGCPIVVLEAMAIGLPVIATNVGGNPELVIDGETGLLIPVEKPEIMAAAILKLLKDNELSFKFGQNGKKRAFTQFHPSSFTGRLQKLYDHLLSNNDQSFKCNNHMLGK